MPRLMRSAPAHRSIQCPELRYVVRTRGIENMVATRENQQAAISMISKPQIHLLTTGVCGFMTMPNRLRKKNPHFTFVRLMRNPVRNEPHSDETAGVGTFEAWFCLRARIPLLPSR